MRAFVLVLDALGIGSAADARRFGDVGADTFGHVAMACAGGKLVHGGRSGALAVPHLLGLGLGLAAHAANPKVPKVTGGRIVGAYGYGTPTSRGKDSASGHWELMGLPLLSDWGHFPHTVPAFPEVLTDMLIEKARLPGILGNCHASGPELLDRFGAEHIETGKPICYTSSDSVFQIAAHEEHFGLDRLYMVCRIARKLLNEYNIGRVIARPFVGARAGGFVRTAARLDYVTAPPRATLMDRAKAHGREVVGIGRIADLFAGSGLTRSIKAAGNGQVFDGLLESVRTAPEGALTVANFPDFDQFGHRRDAAGFADALEAFDTRLPALFSALKPGDLVVLTADHGCDPAFKGSGHTREYVPILLYGSDLCPGALGRRACLADIAQTLARHLGLPPLASGTEFLSEIDPN